MKEKFLSKKFIGLIAFTMIVTICLIIVPERIVKVFAADNYSNIESFEKESIPPMWATENGGSIKLSDKHYKNGTKSLAWSWDGGSTLMATNPANLAAANTKSGGMIVWIYNETPIESGQVTFNFGTADEINRGVYHYTFKSNLNFKGWRSLWIRFREEGNNPEYTGSQNNALEVMQIVPPSSVPSGTLYFDNLEYPKSMIIARSADYQMPKLGIETGTGTWDNVYYYSQQQPTIPLPSSISDSQIDALKIISDRYEKWIFGDSLNYAGLTGPLKIRYDSLQRFISTGLEAYKKLNIVRHADGTITGPALYASRDPHLPKFGEDVSMKILLPLVYDYKINGNIESKQRVIDVLDYMNDQGWADGSALGTQDHETNKNNGYFHTVYLMRNELKEAGIFDREMKTCFWYTNFGKTFDNSTYTETTCDEMDTKFMYNLLYVLGMDNTPQKVQYMKGVVQMYEQAMQIAPGYADTIKPDGTTFHHRGVYMNNYGPGAIHMASVLTYFLSGTTFELSNDAYNNVKNALLTQELIANPYNMAVGPTGRMPEGTSTITSILQAYAYMAFAKNPVDVEMASTFMRLWSPDLKLQTDMFSQADSSGAGYLNTLGGLQLSVKLAGEGYSAKANPQGFWVKPYAGMAVNRINDKMVSIKGWSQYVGDCEAVNSQMDPQTLEPRGQNLYGRYQSYGNMQILSPNLEKGIANSGINVRLGWDWTRWPGTTIKHMSLDEIIHTGDDRLFNDSTFMGGVSLNNKCGLFAMRLHDSVHDTSFRANKSVFFFGDKLVCLGSDIENADSDHQTETVLFQSWMPDSSMPFWDNSLNAVTSPTYSKTIADTEKTWLVDPYGNGYVIPNAAGTVISRGTQNSRNSSGSPNTGFYTTAYINHGAAPAAAGYEYAIKVGAGAQGTFDFASDLKYSVLQKDSKAHIVRNLDTGIDIIGYAVFDSSAVITKGALKSCSDPMMVMIQNISSTEMALSMSDPDLRLAHGTSQSMPYSSVIIPSAMKKDTVTIDGVWRLKESSSDARIISTTEGTTTIEFDCVDGKTIDIGLISQEVAQPILSGIAITTPATKVVYKVGEELDLSGMEVTATYSDSTTKSAIGYEISGYDKNTAGKQVVTVTYQEKTTTFDVTVTEPDPEVTLEKIEITTKPTKTEYKVGEELDLSGMEVTATYSDNTTGAAIGYTTSGYDKSTTGKYVITVTYHNKTATFVVKVKKNPKTVQQ